MVTTMELARILDHEWVPALGCTEPASIACAAAHAASVAEGDGEGAQGRLRGH